MISQSGLCHNKAYRLMANPSILDQDPAAGPAPQPPPNAESFGDILSQFEQSHSHRPEEGGQGLEGTVIAVSGDRCSSISATRSKASFRWPNFRPPARPVKPGDKLPVSIKGRDAEGYYELSRIKVERPKDWSSLEKAFADKAAIAGVVIGGGEGRRSAWMWACALSCRPRAAAPRTRPRWRS